MRYPITFVGLATPDVPGEPLLKDHSWMLSGASSHFDLRGYFFLAPHLKKDASLGTLFENVLPKDGNQFQLELGVILPDLFPNLEGRPEYVVSIAHEGTSRELAFSNVMARLRFTRDEHLLHALIPRRALPKVRAGEVDFIPKEASVELLRTFSTCRFDIQGTTAEEALEEQCDTCMHDMIERLNRLLKIMPFVDLAEGRVYSVAYSRANLPPFYFILKGDSEDNLGHGWISPHVGRTMLNPPNLPSEQVALLTAYLGGTKNVDDVQAFLHAARTFLDGGVNEYVLLLSVIAAEVATQRFVEKRLLSSSVSKTKLVEAEKDLTYSLMLNIVLFAVTPEGRKPDKELVGKMNRARSLRNDYMHEGKLPVDQKELVDLFENTKRFVQYLRELDEEMSKKANQG
jgi:hypothetical protein